MFAINRAVNEDDTDTLRKFISEGIDVVGVIEGVSILLCTINKLFAAPIIITYAVCFIA